MADALAISAAVVQFLDIAVKLTLQLSSLYKEIRDVPQRLQRLEVEIDEQIKIARSVQSIYVKFCNGSPPTITASTTSNQPLADYITTMEQLIEAVRIITKPDGTGIIRRNWSALRATQKCKEAITLCDALEKKKSNITMWLSAASLELSSDIRRLVDGVDKKIDQTLHLGQRLEEASRGEDLQLSRLNDSLSELSVNVKSTLSQVSGEASSSQQQLLTSAANTEAHVRTLTEQWQELSPTFHDLRNILQYSTYLQPPVGQGASTARYPSTQGCEPHVSGNSEAIPKFRLRSSCTCRDIVQATSNESIPFLQFRKIFRQYHFRHCPRWRSSATSLEYLVKIIPPTWLLAHTVHLGFSIQFWNSKSSWKISPLIIGGSRRVDRMKSPAFQAIRNANRLGWLKPEDVRDLHRTLKQLFDAQHASAYDEDHLGSTLLFEVMYLYRWRWQPPSQDQCAQDFVSLIQFLLDSGSDPNIYRLAEDYDESSDSSWCQLGGTVLDTFAIHLVCQEPAFRYDSVTTSLVYEQLVDNNAYFSRPMSEECETKHPTYFFHYFERQMEQFNMFEEQHEVCNLTDLMIAIIHRAEADFDRAIAKGSIHEASDANGLTAIHFAIYWPWALRQLIRAGADVNCEDRLGRRPIHLAVGCGQAEAVLTLLEADCSLYTPSYSKSLLQESLIQGREFDLVTSRIIEALIDRHARLVNLALSVWPDDHEFRQRFGQGWIVETDAPYLWDILACSGYPAVPALQADRDGLGVYDTAEMHARIRLTTILADQLWNGGFGRINDPSPVNNLTPLLQSWFMADFDMVSWFIEKGVSPFSRSPFWLHSGLHLFAARIKYPGVHFHADPDNLTCHEGLFKQLMDDADMWHDSCRCLCSPRGCTPISILVKHKYNRKKSGHKEMVKVSRLLHEKLLYRPEENRDHLEQLLTIFTFERLKFRHTCCRFGQQGDVEEPTEAWYGWRLEGESDYSDSEKEFQQCVADYTSKMLQCGCDIVDKPACTVFRQKCETSRIANRQTCRNKGALYRQKYENERVIYRRKFRKERTINRRKLERRRTVYH